MYWWHPWDLEIKARSRFTSFNLLSSYPLLWRNKRSAVYSVLTRVLHLIEGRTEEGGGTKC